MSGGHSDAAPPDPISNSEVKRISGDGSMGFPHARVAHRQTPITRKSPDHKTVRAFFVYALRAKATQQQTFRDESTTI